MSGSLSLGRFDGGYAAVTGVGTAQSGGAAITESVNLITSETGQTACVLPAYWPAGSPIVVKAGTVAALIFPGVGGQINGASANASFSVTAAKTAVFYPINDGDSVTNWFAVLSA